MMFKLRDSVEKRTDLLGVYL